LCIAPAACYVDGVLAIALMLAMAATPSARSSTVSTSSTTPIMRDVVAGGRHHRLWTEHGAVHVWRPHRYDASTAGLLIYVHGYYTDVDRAWSEHHLADQFASSRQNALFIVPEAPNGKAQEVFWKDLGALLEIVRTTTRLRTPDGPLVVVGHSGAYRTVTEWLKYRRLNEIILLDALYAFEGDFRAWVSTVRGHEANKLVIVSIETIKRSDQFVAADPFAAKRDRIPDRLFDLSRGTRNAQVIYMKSQFDHMGLVTEEKAIPLLLRLTPFERQ
jgi:hypothetical protein